MTLKPTPSRRSPVTRRAVLGGGAAAAAALAARELLAAGHPRPQAAPPRPAAAAAARISAAPVPATLLDAQQPGRVPSIGSSPIPGVAIEPLPLRTTPVYTLADYLPHPPRHAVALTIDDGPDAPWTPEVLAELARHGVKATFSLVGVHVQAEPELVRRIVAEGHGLTNHTMHHLEPFSGLDPAVVDAEVADGLRAIHAATGQLARFFRAPGGQWSPAAFAAAARWGMTPVDWDVDPRDWARPGTRSIIDALLDCSPGDILLCHDGGGDRSQTVRALRTVIPVLLERGLRFVTL